MLPRQTLTLNFLRALRPTTVAQTGSLLCRGLVIRSGATFLRPADYQSAIQQVANLRYAREVPGQGTAIGHLRCCECASGKLRHPLFRETAGDSLSPIGWERAGVRAIPFH